MKRTRSMYIAATAAIAFSLAACNARHGSGSMFEPVAAQQLAVERIDPDNALTEKVKTALGLDAGQGASYGVELPASDGAVDICGTVDGSAVRKRLEVTAAGVVGVKALRNHIQVDPGA